MRPHHALPPLQLGQLASINRIVSFISTNFCLVPTPPSQTHEPGLEVYLNAAADPPQLVWARIVTSSTSTSECLSPRDTQHIQVVWQALRQLEVYKWVAAESADEFLRLMFPEYIVGTSSYGRSDLLAQFVGTLEHGSALWASGHGDPLSPTHPSPIQGRAPILSQALQLFAKLPQADASHFIYQVLSSPRGDMKLQVLSYITIIIITRAHVKSGKLDATAKDTVRDALHIGGEPRYYKVSPSSAVSHILTTLVTCLNGNGFSQLWEDTATKVASEMRLQQFAIDWLNHIEEGLYNTMATAYAEVCQEGNSYCPSLLQLRGLQLRNPGLRLLERRAVIESGSTGGTFWYPFVKLMPNVSRAQIKALNQLFPYTSSTDKKHMTMHLADLVYSMIQDANLTHTKVHLVKGVEVLETIKPNKSGRITAINNILGRVPIGTNNILTMHILLSCYSGPYCHIAREAFLTHPVLMGTTSEVLARLKCLSYLSRRGQSDAYGRTIPHAAVSVLAYTELAFGRSANVTDWASEYNNRCLATTHISSPKPIPLDMPAGTAKWATEDELLDAVQRPHDPEFYKLLRDELSEIVRPLITRRSTTETIEDFLTRRAEWMASGSSGGASLRYSDMPSYSRRQLLRTGRAPTGSVKVGKRAWAEMTPKTQLLAAFRDMKPAEYAKGSEKFENGKSRAIYGVEPLHYIINTYATKGFEEKLHNCPGLEKGVTGIRLSQLEFNRCKITGNHDQHCTMLDYADFNRHHTPEAQSILFDVFADVGKSVGACADWQYANRWVSRAKANMRVTFPNRPGTHKVEQGMFSGTKSTDLINTLLNLAYFNIASKFVAKHYNVHPIDLYNVHQGDDVWLSNRNHLWARLIYYTMNQMGFIFQRSKQMFGDGRGEYLRVLYQDGNATGYLHRALANYILRPLQNDVTQDPVSWAHAISEGTSTMSRRGLPLPLVRVIWTNCMNYWVKARAHNADKCGVRYPTTVIEAEPELGGMGCPLPGTVLLAGRKIDLPNLQVQGKALSGFPSHMTDDWIRHISAHQSKLDHGYRIRSDALREVALQTSYASLPDHITGIADWKRLKADVKVWRDVNTRKLSHHARRYAAFEPKDIAKAVLESNRQSIFDSPSVQFFQSLEAAKASPSVAATPLMGLSEALQRVVASSTFKSIPATATAYGLTRRQALFSILAAAGEDATSSTDARQDLQYILEHPSPEYLDMLLRPGSSVLTALAPFLDSNLVGYCSSQLNQLQAKYLSIFGSDAPAHRRLQAAKTVALACNAMQMQLTQMSTIKY